jgi:hypothetical protein
MIMVRPRRQLARLSQLALVNGKPVDFEMISQSPAGELKAPRGNLICSTKELPQ